MDCADGDGEDPEMDPELVPEDCGAPTVTVVWILCDGGLATVEGTEMAEVSLGFGCEREPDIPVRVKKVENPWYCLEGSVLVKLM